MFSRYRRDRLSLYAGGVVRSSRRPLRSRSAGVAGITADNDAEQGDLSARSSNITGTTETDSQSEHNSSEDKEPQCEADRKGNEADSGVAVGNHFKSNGTVASKPPINKKRRPKSGTLKVHPVITLQVTEDDIDTRPIDQGVDNEVFEGRLDANDNSSHFHTGLRTPPIHELDIFSNPADVKIAADQNRKKDAHQLQQFKLPTVRSLNLNLSDYSDVKQNGNVQTNLVKIEPNEGSSSDFHHITFENENAR